MSQEFSDSCDRISQNITNFEANLESISDLFPLSKSWISAEMTTYGSRPALTLLTAARISLLESATGWALGLNRAAAGSLRTYIENAVSWIYYKDHPVEFSLVATAKVDLFLPKAVQKYLASIDDGYDTCYKYLEKSKSRSNEYYYTDISLFVHAHPNFVLAGKSSSEIIVSIPPDVGFLTMCSYSDEFISDQYLAYYRHSWGSIPLVVQDHISTRIGKKLSEFLAVP